MFSFFLKVKNTSFFTVGSILLFINDAILSGLNLENLGGAVFKETT
jgi:cytidine deaminase